MNTERIRHFAHTFRTAPAADGASPSVRARVRAPFPVRRRP